VATIRLSEDVLAVEALIDAHRHDEAFRKLVLLRERFGRRPEGRYLQALFDATFAVRADDELVLELDLLVADQPDFMEAVSLLAVLLKRVGDRERALVLAREATRSSNPSALRRARDVIGERSSTPQQDERPFHPRLSAKPMPFDEGSAQRSGIVGTETPTWNPAALPFPSSSDSSALRSSGPPSPANFGGTRTDPFRLPTAPPPALRPIPSPHDKPSRLASTSVPPGVVRATSADSCPTLPPPSNYPVGELADNPMPDTVDMGRVGAERLSNRLPFAAAGDHARDARHASVRQSSEPAAMIQVSRSDSPFPQPPTIPPEADRGGRAHDRPADSQPSHQVEASRRASTQPRVPVIPQVPQARRSALTATLPPLPTVRTASEPSPADRVGGRAAPSPSRPAIAIPAPVEQVRNWFRYAREHQVQRLSGPNEASSTALTLLDLAERVVEGATPLSSEPLPLDRRGLVLVEQLLEARRSAGRTGGAERGAVTAAAAYMLALLLKECDGRAADTSAEDGACKVVVPSGTTVRPLLVAAAFARARGPGLVESFDRAATAHMRRVPARPVSSPAAAAVGVAARPRPSPLPANGESELSVLRRDLDASTLGVLAPNAPPALSPAVDMREIGRAFWASTMGRDIMGSSRRVGNFTIADIDAIERFAGKTFNAVGFAPLGTPWPWAPDEEFEELTFSFGAVLGEVLASVYAGRWEADPGNPDDRQLFRVVLTGGVVAWPVAKTYLRLARGIVHDLSVFVDAVGRFVGRQAVIPGRQE
jgi:hypothetical protein